MSAPASRPYIRSDEPRPAGRVAGRGVKAVGGYFRAPVAAMAAYVPGEQPRGQTYIKLNTNENPYPPSPAALAALRAAGDDRLRLYPDPSAADFRAAASETLGVPADWIVPTNGSDEGLALLARACLDPGDLLVAPTPSYLLYQVLAAMQGCRYEERPYLPNGDLPDDFARGARLAVAPNPNSPTGHFLPPERLLALARSGSGLFVADEAYADFAPANCLAVVRDCERLVVCRTFSKAYALAGLRLGFVVAQPVVADTLRKLKDSYNCDRLALAAGAAALRDQDYLKATLKKLAATRERLTESLRRWGFAAAPSHANFVWATSPRPARPLYEELKRRGVLVRYLLYPDVAGQAVEGLRITVGTDAEIDRLLAELGAILGTAGA